MYFDEKVIILNGSAKTKEEALSELANLMLTKNSVNESFLENVLKREEVYPTGLLVNGVGIAIPHTDSEYVKKSQLGFMSLETPVVFNEMGTLDKKVEVNLIFMLALKEAHEQLSMLQQLIEMFQNESVISSLFEIETEEEFIKLMESQNLK
ncbi:PTS sugar transporter subunit IIA [Vagococcus carniphilus]|uniref:PTS sugar transporter subunit IIA n=1 Tax=Vagococcus carniphilus TaxID=218144 RepID=UPI00288DF4EC|nr:PTS sugar transporter subunit IIA [Vagococcus carniphilus]MDT2813960.1 PTS sugar transporter subunit IIA [Vagococcus carniphilus]MDT2864013.1 PTS sugar transporter subunit IIA [Vagococcus carniphilus]